MANDADRAELIGLATEALEHLRLIRKYTAWIAFIVVLAAVVPFLFFLLGIASSFGGGVIE